MPERDPVNHSLILNSKQTRKPAPHVTQDDGTSNQDLFPSYWLDCCQEEFIGILKQNYDNKNSVNTADPNSQLATPSTNDDLFSDPSLVDQSAEDVPGNSIDDELRRYLNDGRYKPGASEDKSPLRWWKDNECRFPWLACCAHNVLAIPGVLTSIPSYSCGS
jgi:hypothetical protein